MISSRLAIIIRRQFACSGKNVQRAIGRLIKVVRWEESPSWFPFRDTIYMRFASHAIHRDISEASHLFVPVIMC